MALLRLLLRPSAKTSQPAWQQGAESARLTIIAQQDILRRSSNSAQPPIENEQPFPNGSSSSIAANRFPNSNEDSPGPIAQTKPTLLSVRKDGLVHKVAGAMASELRRWKMVQAQATGTGPVNLSVKAMCIGRQYVLADPGMELFFRVTHKPGSNRERISNLLFSIEVSTSKLETTNPVEELRVTAASKGRGIGAQIASSIQNNRSPTLQAVGPRSVGNMIVGATWARRLLQKVGLDVICYPSFKMVNIEDKGERTSVEVDFRCVPYANDPNIDSPSDEAEDGAANDQTQHQISRIPRMNTEDLLKSTMGMSYENSREES